MNQRMKYIKYLQASVFKQYLLIWTVPKLRASFSYAWSNYCPVWSEGSRLPNYDLLDGMLINGLVITTIAGVLGTGGGERGGPFANRYGRFSL